MKMDFNKIQQAAKKKLRALERARKDDRYQTVLGRLAHENLLAVNFIRPTRVRPTVEDALWAAEFEPRILELLPGILLRRPKLFLQTKELPIDLREVLRDLKIGKAEKDFRGVPAQKYKFWAEFCSRVKKPKLVQKNYRWSQEDMECIEKLKTLWNISNDTQVLRKALRIAQPAAGK